MQHSGTELQVRDLVAMVAANRLALPEFQRPFVWNPNAVIELIDSLANGWPIGSLLLLEGPQAFAIRGISGGPTFNEQQHLDPPYRYLVLDGQQRITALYHCYADRGDMQYLVNLGDDLHEESSPFSWRRRSNRVFGESTMTLGTALDDRYFSYAIEHYDAKSREMLIRNRRERLGHLVSDENISIPAIVLQRGIDLEALTRIFETLNRTGTPLDAFDLMVSLLYPEGFHLRDALATARKQEPGIEMLETPGIELLKSIALLQRVRERSQSDYHRPAKKRVTGIRQRDVLNTPTHFVVSQWPDAVHYYGDAAEWVRSEGGVKNAATLPSRAMVLTLAHALRNGVPASVIRTWYWQQIALQSYAQGANTQVLADTDSLVDGTWTPAPATSWIESLRAGLLDQSRRNRVLRLGLRGLMVVSGARDVLDGEPLRVGEGVREVSGTSLFQGVLSAPGKDPLVHILYMREKSYEKLQAALSRDSDGLSLLNAEVLSQQQVPDPARLIFLDPDEAWNSRLMYFEYLFSARMGL